MIPFVKASIRTWLLALVILSIVPLTVFSLFLVYDLAQSRQNILLNDVQDRSIAAANGISQQLYQVATMLRVLARSGHLRTGDLAALRAEAIRALSINPAIHSVSMIGPNGRQVINTGVAIGAPMPPDDMPEVAARVFATGQTVLSGPFSDGLTNELSVTIGVPVVLAGRVVYCLRANVSIGAFTEILERQYLPADWTGAVVDAHGIIIGRSKEPESFVGMAASDEVRQSIAYGRHGLVDSVTSGGVAVRASLVSVPGWNWLVAVGAPRSALYAPLYWWFGAVAAAAIVALVLGIIWAQWLSGIIAGRVGQTSLASFALRDGLKPQVPSTQISELDDMVDALATIGRLQEQLRTRELQLRVLADNTSDMIARIDTKGRYLFVSAAARRIFGFADDELIGQSALDFVHPEDQAAVRAAMALVGAGGEPATVRFRRRHKDGHYIWVETAVGAIPGPQGQAVELVIASRDITAQKQIEDRQQLAASVFAETTEGIMITDIDAGILDVNPAFTEITGYQRDEVIGRNPSFLQSGYHDEAFYQQMWRTLREVGRWQGEILNRRKDGGVQPHQMNISAIRDGEGRVIRYLSVFADISERKREQERMESLAYHDALTRLPNRVLLADRLEQALARADRSRTLVAVCYLDLDAFKPVNDKYGHKAGDLVLRHVARCLELGVRGEDTVARLGGDEFVLVLDVRTHDEWRPIVDRVLMLIAEPCNIGDGHNATVTACVGVAVFPEDGSDVDTLLHNADEALYAAKHTGPGQVRLFGEIAMAQSSLPKQIA
jgi:diguanylate cyclase (GGDEF)-like protein/PAS domain S-box-containing protein